MKVILSPKTIEASNLFDVLKSKVTPSEFISLRNSFNQSYYLWKGCKITLSITLCRDTYIKFCNDTTAKPSISFRERIKNIDCEYMFCIPISKSKENIVIHIFLKNNSENICPHTLDNAYID